MRRSMTIQELEALRGSPVYSQDEERIGTVEQVFLDRDTDEPEWIGIGTGFLRTKRVLVPIRGATPAEDGVRVPFDKEHVKGSPDVDEDQISQATEQELYGYYGLKYSERRSDSGLPEGRPTAGKERPEGEAITRHEEELKVGKRPVEAGRLRLHKWVETEPVEAEVELRQEKARVRREPVGQPVSGAEMSEQEIEVPLRGEEPVVEKQTVAKERVTAEKDVDTRRERVSDEVRKERVEAEGEDVDAERT
jgi:uncharacterized protein (TIGR02271 family)